MNGFFCIDKHRQKIFTVDREDRSWLVSVYRVKLYGHPSQDVEHLPDEIDASSGKQNFHKEMDAIFGLLEHTPNDPNPISIDEFVEKILGPSFPRAKEANFSKAKKREDYGL